MSQENNHQEINSLASAVDHLIKNYSQRDSQTETKPLTPEEIEKLTPLVRYFNQCARAAEEAELAKRAEPLDATWGSYATQIKKTNDDIHNGHKINTAPSAFTNGMTFDMFQAQRLQMTLEQYKKHQEEEKNKPLPIVETKKQEPIQQQTTKQNLKGEGIEALSQILAESKAKFPVVIRPTFISEVTAEIKKTAEEQQITLEQTGPASIS